MKQVSCSECARQYINEQIAIMKRFGAEPQLSPKQYERLVERIARVFRKFRKPVEQKEGG